MNAMDLLVTNGTVLTMDARDSRIDAGAVAVRGGEIAAVDSAAALADCRAARVIDAGGGIIMPGLINTHTHAAMTCFRGLADDLPLNKWLQEHIFPAESRLNPDMVYRGTLLACAEMILSGTTCFCDMYLFEDAVARAAGDAGLRAVVGEVLYDFPSPNYGVLEKGFAYTRELIEQWKNHPLVTIAVEAHSTYLCAPDLITEAASIAAENNLPFVIHLSETQDEVAQIRERYGVTPAGYLAEQGVLRPNLLACHCVHLTPEDMALLKEFDVKVSHNPESNMKLASGIAPIPELLREGVTVGLGTDGCASNNDLDLFMEMDMAAKLHKVHTLDPTVMDARTVLRMATIDGARALGLDEQIGSLEKGKRADMIVLDTCRPHLTPMYDPCSHLVYAAKGSDVVGSIVEGRVLMENRMLETLEMEKILRDIRHIAETVVKPAAKAGG